MRFFERRQSASPTLRCVSPRIAEQAIRGRFLQPLFTGECREDRTSAIFRGLGRRIDSQVVLNSTVYDVDLRPSFSRYPVTSGLLPFLKHPLWCKDTHEHPVETGKLRPPAIEPARID